MFRPALRARVAQVFRAQWSFNGRTPRFCARRRTRRHARSTLLGSGAVPVSEQNTQDGTSGHPQLICSRLRDARRSKSSSARPAVMPTVRPEPLLGVDGPTLVMLRRMEIRPRSKSMSDHCRPRASPRLIPVANSAPPIRRCGISGRTVRINRSETPSVAAASATESARRSDRWISLWGDQPPRATLPDSSGGNPQRSMYSWRSWSAIRVQVVVGRRPQPRPGR